MGIFHIVFTESKTIEYFSCTTTINGINVGGDKESCITSLQLFYIE